MWLWVFELLAELLVEFVIEVGFDAALGALIESLQKSTKANPLLAGLGSLILGVMTGGVGLLLFRQRLTSWHYPLSGGSLVLAPLLVGIAMRWYGKWRRSRKAESTFLATFAGGALFAFGMASVRWVVLR